MGLIPEKRTGGMDLMATTCPEIQRLSIRQETGYVGS